MISDYAVSFGSLQDYTSPYRWLKQRFGDAELVNIHGTINSESIFGIDGSGNFDDRDILPFTKTYRVLKSARGIQVARLLILRKGEGMALRHLR